MSDNPYHPPAAVDADGDINQPSRGELAAVIESFLQSDITAFEFDEQLDRFRDADDPVLQYVAGAVWYHYDDCEDHLVCLSKAEWDYFQRLLLLLASDCQIEVSTTRIWSVRQLAAGISLAVFTYFACQFGWGRQLLALAIPFGFISMLIAYLPRRLVATTDPYEPIIYPFASIVDLETAYHAAGFRKVRYPRLIGGRSICSPFMDSFYKLYTLFAWCLFAPIPLLFQCFPEVASQAHARAV